MPEIFRQAIESTHNLPTDVAHPIEAIAVVAVAALASLHLTRNFNRTQDYDARDFSNVEQLLKSKEKDPMGTPSRFAPALNLIGATAFAGRIKNILPSKSEEASADLSTEDKQATLEKKKAEVEKKDRKERIIPTLVGYIGLGAVAATFVGGINYETDKVDTSPNAVFVKDVSNSMARTTDIGGGKSRLDAVNDALTSIDYKGNLAEVQVGDNSKVVMPLTHNWKTNKNLISSSNAVDPNGGKMAPAISLAASLFPITSGSKGEQKGTIIVASDGTIDDSEKLLAVSNTLKQQGVKVKFIVPGTASGSYKFTPKSSPKSSKVSPESFKAFDNKDIIQTQTAKQTKEAISKVIVDSSKTNHKYPWYPLALIGAGMALYGGAKNHNQRWKRTT